ncbi:hypothetical protein [Flavobacterium oreochromis]|uniref:Uncharacterized protein n=1 Tax=Flavobacterium columnare TaxID=996 RepID=A0A246G813_9FLAO|nr:hypothetical protein [Flavobacterium oreochromis]OWP74825.1 hypothetical protein BWK62_13350 [Flavobacterium oreochromis]
MKTIFQITLILFFINEPSFSQGPPDWAPAHGYRAKTRYVYFPDHNFYYDLQAQNYIYLKGNNWEIKASLPSPFININLGQSSQVELDFYGERPYFYNENHIVRYKKIKKYKEKYYNNNIIEIHEDIHPRHGRGRGHKH